MMIKAHIVVNMLILQFQVTQADENEIQIVPNFCQWICNQIFSNIDTRLNRDKISARMSYIRRVPWIHWTSNKNISVQDIMNTIQYSFKYEQHELNYWVIELDSSVRIPHTDTSMSRLIRFLNSGDLNIKGTGIITAVQRKYGHSDLNTLWKMYIMQELGYLPDSILKAM